MSWLDKYNMKPSETEQRTWLYSKGNSAFPPKMRRRTKPLAGDPYCIGTHGRFLSQIGLLCSGAYGTCWSAFEEYPQCTIDNIV